MKFKYSLAIIVLVAILGVFVFAQTPLSVPPPIIVNAISCSETDGGLSYYTQGNITGSFWWAGVNGTNVSYVGSLTDTCTSSTILLEGVCGSSVNATGLAGALYVDCSAPNSAYGCFAGRCAFVGNNNTGNNSTNLSLPDLVVSNFTLVSYVLNSTNPPVNGSNSSSYNVVVNAVARNNGPGVSTPTSLRIQMTNSPPGLNGDSNWPIGTLSSGGTSSITMTFYGIYSGTRTGTATADWTNNIAESNEGNNIATLTVVLP